MDKERFIKKLDNICNLNMKVLGDVMLDMYDFCYTEKSRPSPEKKDKRVYTSHKTITALGGAGNVATNLQSLGVNTTLISIAGKDGHFFTLQELADKSGIRHCIVQDKSRPTTTKFRLYIDDEYLLRRDDEESFDICEEISATVISELMQELKNTDAVVISDYNKGFFTEKNSRQIIEMCNKENIPVIVDFKPANCGYFDNATIIAPNEVEAKALFKGFNEKQNLEDDVASLYKKLNCKNMAVTLGANGICSYDGEKFSCIPAFKVNAVDAVGCGDTVRAALAIGFSLGMTLEECTLLANAAAAVVVQKTGTATVSKEELADFIKNTYKD